MNILFFTHEKAYGGSSRALITLIDELLKTGLYNIYVITPFKKSKINDELKKRNVTIICSFYSWWQIPKNISKIKKVLFKLAYKLNFLSIWNLTRQIKKLNIDVIHSNTSVIDIGAIIAKKLNINHIWHFREYTGRHLSFIKKDEEVYNFINNNTDKVIYISKAIEKFYSKNINKSLGNLVYDGVSSDFIIDKKYKINKKVKFLLVGTLEKNKGQKIAIEAARILKNKKIDNFEIIFAGGDPTNYSKDLQILVDNYKLKENVKFIGFVSNIKKLREEVDVELMCSPSEAFGLVTVEGMLAGNVVIGSNSGATPEIVDNEFGFLYELNNYEDLASKMEYLIKNRTEIKKIGRKGQKEAIEKFSSKKHAENIMAIYNEFRK